MLTNRKNLHLNSYKIDTESLQTSLRELSEMKNQLETTISHYKQHEEHLIEENERLKEEILILQNKAQVKVDHSDCNIKMLKLESELKECRREAERVKKIQDIDRKNKDSVIRDLEGKLEREKMQARSVIDKYQQRIVSLSVELKQAQYLVDLEQREKRDLKQQLQGGGFKKTNKLGDSHGNLKIQSDYESTGPYKKNNEKLNINEIPRFNTTNTVEQKKNNQTPIQKPSMPPKSPNKVSPQSSYDIRQIEKNNTGSYSYSASFVNDDQEVFSAAIRKLYAEIKDLGLSAQEMSVLPQFKKMKENGQPSKNDLINFLKCPPIQQKNQNNVIRSVNYLEGIIKKKYGKVKGNFVTETIIARVQEYENSSKLKTEDLEISGMTPSLSKMESSSQGMMSNQYINSQYANNNQKSKASINDNIKIESEGSFF